MKIHLENTNPTKTEEILFLNGGYYVIDRYSVYGCDCIKYAVCHVEKIPKEFPKSIDVEKDCIEDESYILFDGLSESITIHGNFLVDALQLLINRAKELGWKE